MFRSFLLVVITILTISHKFIQHIQCFKINNQKLSFQRFSICLKRNLLTTLYNQNEKMEDSFNNDINKTMKAMQNARDNLANKVSPGAGLASADEQADAAYADLINTSMDQRGIDSLSTEELALLSKGGRMWEEGSTSQKRKFGVFGDILNIINAVAGGAQIEKNKYGET